LTHDKCAQALGAAPIPSYIHPPVVMSLCYMSMKARAHLFTLQTVILILIVVQVQCSQDLRTNQPHPSCPKEKVLWAKRMNDPDTEYDLTQWSRVTRTPSLIQLARVTRTLSHNFPKGWNPLSAELCMQNKSVPSLYVLGAQKCGTTSFTADIKVRLGAYPPHGHKEPHFFDNSTLYEDWLAQMPGCGEKNNFVFDATPRNLRLTHVPATLNKFYRSHLNDVTFVVLLREPLSRYQSAYYFGVAIGMPMDPGVNSFSELVKKDISAAKQKKTFSDGFWGSMYAEQLDAFLEYINSSQFMILISSEYFARPAGVIQQLAERMGGKRLEHVDTFTPSHANAHGHPTVDEDLDTNTKRSYDDFMVDANQKLFHSLWTMTSQGAYINAPPGFASDEKTLTNWINGSW